MENTSGFYQLDGGLLFAPNFVDSPNIRLDREYKDEYVYPQEGWYWFDTLEEANIFFEINN